MALKTLPQLADVFSRLNRPAALQYGKILGLDEATILLLQQGRREVDAVVNRQKELGVITDKNADTFLNFRNTLNETGDSFRFLFTTLALAAIPTLTELLNGTTKVFQYVTEHKDVVVGSFTAIAAAIGLMLAPILSTYAAVAALIAAIGVLYEDVKAFKEGRNSFLGDITKKYGYHIPSPEELKGQSIENRKAFEQYQALPLIDKLLTLVGQSPINNQTSSSILNSLKINNANPSVSIGDITIQTQATDAVGISHDLREELTKQWGYEQAANYFADGKYA